MRHLPPIMLKSITQYMTKPTPLSDNENFAGIANCIQYRWAPMLYADCNGMDARFLNRHQSAKEVVAVSTTKIEKGIHHEDYYCRHRTTLNKRWIPQFKIRRSRVKDILGLKVTFMGRDREVGVLQVHAYSLQQTPQSAGKFSFFGQYPIRP